MIARKAWERWAKDEWSVSGELSAEAAQFRAWRTREQFQACGQHSLTTCLVSDFPALMAGRYRAASVTQAQMNFVERCRVAREPQLELNFNH
ncbi:MAG: hypothetical protein PF795_00740 [Kiritimatiellae bacterium]|nr:hypothetical protein [Kiritimatiellia bacterium]